MLLRHAIGHVLRRIRLKRQLTLRDLARRSQVSVPYLSEIERGRKEASSEVLATVCRVLDLSVGELLTAVSLELGGAEAAPAIAAAAEPARGRSARVVSIESHTEFGGRSNEHSASPMLLAA
jgi:transcriptional regulator with XRE-family HTH domain